MFNRVIGFFVFLLFICGSAFSYSGTVDGSDGVWTTHILIDATTAIADKTFDNSTIIENFDFAIGDGGALHSVLTITFGEDMILQNNTSSTKGGAVYIGESSSITLNVGHRTKFDSNIALGNGGAVYDKGAYVSFGNDVEFNNNSAVNGGASYIDGGRYSLSDGAKFVNNTASVEGGSIYNNSGTLFIYEAEFSGNTATVNGGALYLKGGATYIRGDVVFSGNSAVNGGAIYQDTGTINIYTDMADVQFATVSDSVYSKNGTINVSGSGHIDGSATTFEMIGESATTLGTLYTGTAVIEFDTITMGDYTTLNIAVGKDANGVLQNGSLKATTFNISTVGTNLTFNVGTGAVAKFDDAGNPVVETITIFDGATSDLYGANMTISNNLYDIVWVSGGDYQISRKDNVSTQNIVAISGGDTNLINVAKAWNDGSDFTAGTVGATFADGLYALAQNDADAYVQTLSALAPSSSKFVYESTTEKVAQIHKSVSNRLGSNYAMDKEIEKHYEGFWVEGLYAGSTYSNEKSVSFDTDTYGGMIGYDGDASLNLRLGFAYGYSRTNADLLGKEIVADDHSFLFYGQYLMSEKWYIDGIASYTYSNSNENKNVTGVQISAEADTEMTGVQLSTGYLIGSKTFNIAPEIGTRYVSISQGDYEDTAGQSVMSASFNNVIGFGKLNLNMVSTFGSGAKIGFKVYGGAGYDILAQEAEYNVALSNGESYKISPQYFDKLSYEAGASIEIHSSGMFRMRVGYDGRFREDYEDNSYYLNLGLQF